MSQLLSPTALKVEIFSMLLAISEDLKNIFNTVGSISVKCVIMISCGDSASVGLSFHLFSFWFCKYLF